MREQKRSMRPHEKGLAALFALLISIITMRAIRSRFTQWLNEKGFSEMTIGAPRLTSTAAIIFVALASCQPAMARKDCDPFYETGCDQPKLEEAEECIRSSALGYLYVLRKLERDSPCQGEKDCMQERIDTAKAVSQIKRCRAVLNSLLK